MNIKESFKNIAKYVSLGIVGGLTLFNTAKAQSTEYKKPITEIRTEGDNIIIPENKLEEFLKNYKPKQNQTLNKTTDITLDGYITDALTTNPLEGIKVTAQIYDGATLTGTYGPAITDFTGYYQLSGITDVEDEQSPNNQATIQYFGNKIFTNNFNEKTLKIYDAATKEEVKTITTTDPTININLEGIASGRYITIIKTKNTQDINLLVQDNGTILGYTKTQKIGQTNNKQLEKINTLGIVMNIEDPTNNHHRYFSGAGEFSDNNPQRDFTLIPRINLETRITDPEYTIIPTIKTQRDLIWYTARVQGEWDNQEHGNRQFPIQLFIDENNAPIGAAIDARSVIQYFQDSLGIHPDSLIKESPTEIPPDFNNGISAAKIIWTDSIGTEGFNMTQGFIFSSSHNTFIGTELAIDTNKVVGEDIGKYIALGIQRYITGGINPINNNKYLGYTTANRIGPTKRPNNDEKQFIKTGRFSKPYYINRVYP